MFVSPQDIVPSQDYLKPDTVRHIFACIENWNFDSFPPPPIVRKDSSGKLVAIDGHNLIAVKYFLGEELRVHVAESADDGIQEASEANKIRNEQLKKKFDSALAEKEKVEARGIRTFQDLINMYPELFESEKIT